MAVTCEALMTPNIGAINTFTHIKWVL